MKDMGELENMTLFDITSNEGSLTNFIVGTALIMLSIMYLFCDLYYWLKFRLKGIGG